MKTRLLSFLILLLGSSAISQVKDSLRLSTKVAQDKLKQVDSSQHQLKKKLDSLQLTGNSTVNLTGQQNVCAMVG